MKDLNINDILNSDDLKKEVVDIEQWGGRITIQEMTGASLDEYESSLWEIENVDGKVSINRDSSNARAKLIAACVVDSAGNKMFKSPEQVKALGSKSGKVLDLIHKKCREINGLENSGEDEGKSEANQSGDSSTDMP